MRYKPKRRMVTAIAAVTVAAGTALVSTAVEATAVVAPAPVVTANGSAGYDATTAAVAGFTDVQTVVDPTQYGLTVKTGAQGVQLCSSVMPGRTAQIGLVSTNTSTTYAVDSATGPLAGCPAGGVLPGRVAFPGLAAVPYGHHVWVNAMQVTRARIVSVLICVNHGMGHFTCTRRMVTIPARRVVFEAQDLDAMVTGAPAGDQPGVQTRIMPVAATAVYNHASVGVNENQTTLAGCTGAAADGFTYPRTLLGPAAYVSGACQPITTEEFSTATVGAGLAQDFGALTTTEGISPNATDALVAPNNTLSTANTGPHGTAGDASVMGSHLQVNTGNVPTM